MLHINKKTMEKCISVKEVINQIDLSYELYENELYEMPTRSHMTRDNNTLLLMPAYVNDVIATKLVTVFPSNKKINEPTINALMVLNCRDTGKIKATLDGTYLTAIRTGAVGGSAVRHLAPENAKTLAIIGAGVQGLYQTIAACEERKITDVYIYNRTKEKVPEFIKLLSEMIDKKIRIHATETVEIAIKKADIVITATTSNLPVLPNNESLLKGKLFIGVGSFQPNMREFPKALYNNANQVYVDSTDAIEESGDLIDPLQEGWLERENIITLSSVIATNKIQKDSKSEKSIVFKTTGMALFDAVVANAIYKAAIEDGSGIDLI